MLAFIIITASEKEKTFGCPAVWFRLIHSCLFLLPSLLRWLRKDSSASVRSGPSNSESHPRLCYLCVLVSQNVLLFLASPISLYPKAWARKTETTLGISSSESTGASQNCWKDCFWGQGNFRNAISCFQANRISMPFFLSEATFLSLCKRTITSLPDLTSQPYLWDDYLEMLAHHISVLSLSGRRVVGY